MSPIEFVDDLPPKPHGKGKGPAYGWEAEDEVRANPGRWAKVWTYPARRKSGKQSSAAFTSAGAARKRGFDTAVRPTEDGEGRTLYLRWPADDQVDDRPKMRPAKDGATVNRAARAKPVGRKPVGYPCDHCEEDLPTPAALKVHVRRHHPEHAA